MTNSTQTNGTTITRGHAPTRCGGDLWNDAQVARRVFVHPAVESFRITRRLSGLYCDVQARLCDGRTATMRVSDASPTARVESVA